MSDVKEARERLRRCKTEDPDNVYRGMTDDVFRVYDLRNVDRAILADNDLAEHPDDDDEPLLDWRDPWLESVGFGDERIDGFRKLIDGIDGSDPVELVLAPSPEVGWIASLYQSNEEDHVTITGRDVKTRGDVRRLCEVLGEPLEEPA
jgi:hypothetical protein